MCFLTSHLLSKSLQYHHHTKTTLVKITNDEVYSIKFNNISLPSFLLSLLPFFSSQCFSSIECTLKGHPEVPLPSGLNPNIQPLSGQNLDDLLVTYKKEPSYPYIIRPLSNIWKCIPFLLKMVCLHDSTFSWTSSYLTGHAFLVFLVGSLALATPPTMSEFLRILPSLPTLYNTFSLCNTTHSHILTLMVPTWYYHLLTCIKTQTQQPLSSHTCSVPIQYATIVYSVAHVKNAGVVMKKFWIRQW